MLRLLRSLTSPRPDLRLVLAILAGAALAACGPSDDQGGDDTLPAASGFEAQASQFPRGVVEVADGIHVAIGYGLGNSILIEGEGGVVIVDTLESVEAATPVREAFRAISDDPVAAIVYTHSHADHVFGAGVLAGADRPEVIAHSTFDAELGRLVSATRRATFRRSMRQFGTMLAGEERLHCGVGPRLLTDAGTTPSFLLPTRTFDGDRLEITVAGVRMVLLHLPGETPDHVAVWLPDRRVLLPGDNYYHAFPNLYAIRGTAYRDVLGWTASIDAMRALKPAILVPSHTLPVHGEDEVWRRLTDYRDAIQFVHDQTLRALNAGMDPEQAVAAVRLPKELAAKPWLAEYYGRVDWSVRAVFDGYLGWFGGDAASLSPLTRRARAERTATLAGGTEKLREEAAAALERGDPKWALELAGHLEALGEHHEVAARVRAAAVRVLGAGETSANGRNYYLTQALEAEGAFSIPELDSSRMPSDLLAHIPVEDFLRAMVVNLDPARAEGKSLAVGFRFPDTGEEWGMRLRNSIVELEPRLPAAADMTVTVDSLVWKEILARKRNATAAFARGDVQVDRNRLELVRFLFLFR